jgi:hypothetical protein
VHGGSVAHVNKLPSHSPMVYGSPIWWDWSNRDEADADHHPTASYLVNEQERELKSVALDSSVTKPEHKT